MSEHGAEAEALVESICRTMFLKDFTVRSPPYTKGSGVQKEAADVLVPFGDVLIAFQVKSKKGPANSETAGDTYLQRVEKTVSEGIDQLKTIKRAVKAGQIATLKNVAGVELPFNPAAVRKIVGVVVLDLPDQRDAAPDAQLGVFNGFQERHGIPAHVFRSDELQTLAEEIDTLPDFLAYLELRETLFSKGHVAPLTAELDLLAFYKMRPEQLKEAAQSPDVQLILDDRLWDEYCRTYAAQRAQRSTDNAPAYLIDHAIEAIHAAIGFPAPGKLDIPPSISLPANSVETYAALVLELARLSRLERRLIGTAWLDKMRKAQSEGLGYAVVRVSENSTEALLVIASDEPNRQQRAQLLFSLAAMAYCHLGATKLLALITEPLTAPQRSYDCLMLAGVGFQNEADLRRQAAQFFGPHRSVTHTEFREARKPSAE